ncbi:MAG: HAD family hydrolase, partial [Deltaproteobacteria bacterium]|nr:HAD family hydrolase [Deltaproteobacteria bacterium]
MKKKVIIFDFDGTLVDSMNDFADVAASVMPRHFPVDAETAKRLYIESS